MNATRGTAIMIGTTDPTITTTRVAMHVGANRTMGMVDTEINHVTDEMDVEIHISTGTKPTVVNPIIGQLVIVIIHTIGSGIVITITDVTTDRARKSAARTI